MAENVKEEDTFQILLATDCHLGYMERDAIRRSDSILVFEEILQIAVERNVDFILLGGDLFHDNKPSRKTLHQCMKLLRQYCMGDRPIQFQFLSDQTENFKHSSFPIVNYEDPNLNLSVPVFSIHGNHDDPAGSGSLCSLDLLSVSGLVNYFGKCLDLENVQISPILLQKGATMLALYGLGSIRDERLHRLFREGKVSMMRPREHTEDWFNVFVLHQNRIKHGVTNYIPEQFLDDFLDLVVWGHEHECKVAEEWNSQQNFYVTQPGSSIATSLCHGEAVPKHVGLLQVNKKTFKITEIPLKTVRPFYIKDVDLDDISLNVDEPGSSKKVSDYCREIIEDLLEKADSERSGHALQPAQPLIRLRVFYPENFETFSIQRFGQSYVNRVANPKDLLAFTRKKSVKVKVENIDAAALKGVLHQEGFDRSRVEDMVKQYFQLAEDTKQLALLSENGVGNAIQEFVDKEVSDAIVVLVDHQMKKVQGHLNEKQVNDETIQEEIKNFRQDRMRNTSEEISEFQAAMRESSTNPVPRNVDDAFAQDEETMFHDDDDSTMPIAVPRGRGRGRGRARGRATTTTRGGRGSRGRGTNRNDTTTASTSTAPLLSSSARSSQRITDHFDSSSRSGLNATWKTSTKNNTSIFLGDDSDDLDSSIRRSSKRKKTASTTRGIMYDSDSDASF